MSLFPFVESFIHKIGGDLCTFKSIYCRVGYRVFDIVLYFFWIKVNIVTCCIYFNIPLRNTNTCVYCGTGMSSYLDYELRLNYTPPLNLSLIKLEVIYVFSRAYCLEFKTTIIAVLIWMIWPTSDIPPCRSYSRSLRTPNGHGISLSCSCRIRWPYTAYCWTARPTTPTQARTFGICAEILTRFWEVSWTAANPVDKFAASGSVDRIPVSRTCTDREKQCYFDNIYYNYYDVS